MLHGHQLQRWSELHVHCWRCSFRVCSPPPKSSLLFSSLLFSSLFPSNLTSFLTLRVTGSWSQIASANSGTLTYTLSEGTSSTSSDAYTTSFEESFTISSETKLTFASAGEKITLSDTISDTITNEISSSLTTSVTQSCTAGMFLSANRNKKKVGGGRGKGNNNDWN